MDDYADLTVATYNASANKFANHFQKYNEGAALKEIEETLRHIDDLKPARVVELGCGAGKEAAEIVKRVGWYEGFDPAGKLLALARKRVPEASFVLADAQSYNWPADLDAVFAFASMLHLNKSVFQQTCQNVLTALRPGGLLCMTLKEADAYSNSLQKDDFGERMFYFYNPELVRQLAGPSFKQVFEAHQAVGPKQKRWFTLILEKL